jgi:uncharacterized membrane-anchored protein
MEDKYMIEQKNTGTSTLRQMLNKVPEITLYFWIIKILCTTIGETAADFLNVNLNLGLTGVSIITGVLLVIVIFFQFRTKKYIPSIYWTTVALVSVFGTLVTDNLTDKLGVPLEVSTIIFSIFLAITFLVWYLREKTLSIHSIFTTRRESFYWLAILFTFALGTASGDLMAESLGLGYFVTGLIVAGVIALTAIAWKSKLNSVLSFWIIYIMTRPLGASIGDYLSQPGSHSGLGLGTTVTSLIFVVAILGLVTYLSLTKKDVIVAATAEYTDESKEKGGIWQTVAVLFIFIIAGGTGYYFRHAVLQAEIAAPQAEIVAPQKTAKNGTSTSTKVIISSLGDLSLFKTITQDTLDKLNTGDQKGATTRICDLEYEWDNAQSRLKSRDNAEWTKIDGKIDTVLRELRSVHPNVASEKSAIQALLPFLISYS